MFSTLLFGETEQICGFVCVCVYKPLRCEHVLLWECTSLALFFWTIPWQIFKHTAHMCEQTVLGFADKLA